MSQMPVDPLRFLNIKKKRQNNKQRVDLKLSFNKEMPSEETSRFVLPSLSSQNSLDRDERSIVKKVYNPMKYFNPEIQEYLNKLRIFKIVNSPVMPAVQVNSVKEEKKEEKKEENLFKIFKNQAKEMMTFAKNLDFGAIAQTNQVKTSFNFFKPGLKKSGSMKMIQKLQEQNPTGIPMPSQAASSGISPWQLPENLDQNQQLRECEVCNRKFNIKSYEKHVKVCEKVFFQKRKPFVSRSNSMDGKKDRQ